MLKVQVISSRKCEFCKKYFQRLDKLGFTDYQVYDADNPDNRKQLDDWRDIDMPVIQVVEDSGEVKYTFPYSERGYTPRALKYKLKELGDTK